MNNARRDWSALVKEQAESGQSASEFCRARGISDSTFSGWRKKLEQTDKFVRIDTDDKIEIELKSKVSIRVSPKDLTKVLRALCAQ